jgi:putative oxygen-independent coproporphyrinogen III oxidase
MPSLYVHVPFCIQKCDYCAFYSLPFNKTQNLASLYLEGLELEMAKRQKDAPEGVSSLFIGGGTPTVLGDRDFERLLAIIQRYFCLTPGAESTVEGNPGTITMLKLESLQRFGINRFSLGVQAFDDKLLRAVGRKHSASQARKAIGLLRTAGFKNLNLDLMFGLPTQTMKDWQDSIEEALSYTPEHLSLYGLMLEEGTPLYALYEEEISDSINNSRNNLLPDDDMQAEMHDWAVKRLKQAGYRHYETSNFARPGFECQHNLGYWRGEDYLGFGPGGVSCLNRVRWKNIEDVRVYQDRLKNDQAPLEEAGQEALSLQEVMAERMILGLRLEEGVNLASFKKDFASDVRDIYKGVLERYYNQGILVIQDEYLRLNPNYSFIANTILQEFV